MDQDQVGTIKQFMMTNILLEHHLDEVERGVGLDLGRGVGGKAVEPDKAYYPQIEQKFRSEAAHMAPHYEVFYSLEKTIRQFISDALTADFGPSWWAQKVPSNLQSDVEMRRQKEINSGMTVRSDNLLDFTTFGELGEIIKANWDVFDGMLSSRKAVERVMSNLNSLRGPIAHCSPLAEDEIVRLNLSVRDWFRLMD